MYVIGGNEGYPRLIVELLHIREYPGLFFQPLILQLQIVVPLSLIHIFGVGVGNCVSIVTGKTPMDKVAELIVKSKKFDNSTSCSTENNIVVLEDCYDEFVKEMAAHGAVLFREGSEEKAKLQKTMWPNTPDDHVLNRAIVAQSAEQIADLAGLDVPAGTKLLMAEEFGGFGTEHPFTGEKLSPCLLYTSLSAGPCQLCSRP